MYKESQTVTCDCETFFDVVADVGRYPAFLPGWERVSVSERPDGSLHVTQRIRFGPITEELDSIAHLQRPHWIGVYPASDQVTRGIALEWSFSPHSSGHCQVELRVEGRARNPLVRGLLNTVVQRTSQAMIQRFTERVTALYGESCRII